jgi:ferredoxin
MSEVPAVFRVDPATGVLTVLDEHPPAELRAQLALAVQHCPTRALALDDA